jgi:glycosyltransferase involved in cell wall biosynthesis
MSDHQQPLVSVLTPVYNGEAYLAECIESVLKQTYQRFEYIIVNNCSTDNSLEIARSYVSQDYRIKVHDNERFVDVITNHNIAFGLISPDAKYCKVVSGDDFLFPECLERLVECGEAHPSVGIIGSYQLSGSSYIRWQGFQYPTSVFAGRDVGRRFFLGQQQVFLGGQPVIGFGTPTSILYRSDLVRQTFEFYPNLSPHSDTSACFKHLRNCEFGFVYQVLSYERTHTETQSHASSLLNRYSSATLNDLLQYGSAYLSGDELAATIKATLLSYYRFLAINLFIGRRDKPFWSYHQLRLRELGYPLRRRDLARGTIAAVATMLKNPLAGAAKLWRRMAHNNPSQPVSEQTLANKIAPNP